MNRFRIVQYSAAEYAIQEKKLGLFWMYCRDGCSGFINTYRSVEDAEKVIRFWESHYPLQRARVVKEL